MTHYSVTDALSCLISKTTSSNAKTEITIVFPTAFISYFLANVYDQWSILVDEDRIIVKNRFRHRYSQVANHNIIKVLAWIKVLYNSKVKTFVTDGT